MNRNFGLSLFDEFFNDPFFRSNYNAASEKAMKTDITEKDGQYILDIELPGFSREDIVAELNKGYLTITATRNETIEQKEDKSTFIRRERYHGSYKRSFYVGEQMRQEDIQASFRDGILRLTVPKEPPRTIEDTRKLISID